MVNCCYYDLASSSGGSLLRKRLVVAILLLAASCSLQPENVLRLATTTSTYDSGLLNEILPGFELQFNARVDVVAVGTGQALALGRRGDADLLLVHEPIGEAAFVRDGHGTMRYPVMFNDFIIVGPGNDPAQIRGMREAKIAFKRIAEQEATFISRGDGSGTFVREQRLWELADLHPSAGVEWYLSVGQGMGESLQMAAEMQAYALTDRGTFLALAHTLEGMDSLVGGNAVLENEDPELLNIYSLIPVNPEVHTAVQFDLAMQYVNWMLAPDIQRQILGFGNSSMGAGLFLAIDSLPE